MAHLVRRSAGRENPGSMPDGFRWEVEIDDEPALAADDSAAWTDLIDRVRMLNREPA